MSWSRQEVHLLIQEYQKHPCLYAVKTPAYKNKHARIQALNQIHTNLRKLKPEVSINDIKTKFAALKSTFLNEHRKTEESKNSGVGEESVSSHYYLFMFVEIFYFQLYTPTLWYYEQMYFVLEHQAPRQAIDSYVS